jgi:hypothetical protein
LTAGVGATAEQTERRRARRESGDEETDTRPGHRGRRRTDRGGGTFRGGTDREERPGDEVQRERDRRRRDLEREESGDGRPDRRADKRERVGDETQGNVDGGQSTRQDRERPCRDFADDAREVAHDGERRLNQIKHRDYDRLPDGFEHVVELLTQSPLHDDGVRRALLDRRAERVAVLLRRDFGGGGGFLVDGQLVRGFAVRVGRRPRRDFLRVEVESETRGEPSATRQPHRHLVGDVGDGAERRVERHRTRRERNERLAEPVGFLVGGARVLRELKKGRRGLLECLVVGTELDRELSEVFVQSADVDRRHRVRHRAEDRGKAFRCAGRLDARVEQHAERPRERGAATDRGLEAAAEPADGARQFRRGTLRDAGRRGHGTRSATE